MDIDRYIAELHAEKKRIDRAIAALEVLLTAQSDGRSNPESKHRHGNVATVGEATSSSHSEASLN
ncbi:MAG: hypothetical protein U0Q18_25875 [Bryobacteraceae bacterium]